MPITSGDVPDDMEMKLVVIDCNDPHIARDTNSPAYQKAKEILTTKGTSQRLYRNTLIFLAPDKTRLEELKVAIRSYLAWATILKDKEIGLGKNKKDVYPQPPKKQRIASFGHTLF